MYTQDINELTISGHVNQAPRLDDDTDVIAVCRFVLTHTTHAIDRRRPGWEQQHYNVTAYDKVAETFTERHQPGQVIVITGELDLQIQATLIGPLPAITIIAHRIVLVDGPLNPAASIAVPDPQLELAHTQIGPVPHTRAGW
jgi:hypothetical protein